MKIDFTEKRLAMATLSVAALFGVLGPASAVADDEAPKGYIMNFYADSAHGAAVEDGAYEVVIDKLEARSTDSARRVAAAVNLCVAYTKTKQIDKATETCDHALEIAGKAVRRISFNDSFRAAQARALDERAIALINRGVLYAVAGKDEQAKEMFEMANSLSDRNESAALNLLVLQREVAEKDT